MNDTYRVLLHPRKYGLQVYTDSQLLEHSKSFLGELVYRGEGKEPATILEAQVVPEGIVATCRVLGENARS